MIQTAADFSNLPGFREGTEAAPVMTDREANTRKRRGACIAYSVHSCPMCGAEYLRVHGARGRKRSFCSKECKDLPGTLRAAAGMLSKISEHQGTTDRSMANLRGEVWGLVNHRAFAVAVHRNSVSVKDAVKDITNLLYLEPATLIEIKALLHNTPAGTIIDALVKMTKGGAVETFRLAGKTTYKLSS